jgi:hypothetical protein
MKLLKKDGTNRPHLAYVCWDSLSEKFYGGTMGGVPRFRDIPKIYGRKSELVQSIQNLSEEEHHLHVLTVELHLVNMQTANKFVGV